MSYETNQQNNTEQLGLESFYYDRLPVNPKLCFNWLPTYRYALLAYKGLQQSCANLLEQNSKGLHFGTTQNKAEINLNSIRPIALDSILQTDDHTGYLNWQFPETFQKFSNGKNYYPITEDLALVVSTGHTEKDFLNNVVPYMTAGPNTLTASLAISGNYAGVSDEAILLAHQTRKQASHRLRHKLSQIYSHEEQNILIHLNAVGGIIEATLRNLSKSKPNFATCCLAPEYWDFMRFVLTYSSKNLRLVKGREKATFPKQDWLEAVSDKSLDLIYLSYTSNPVGTAIPEDVFYDTLNNISDDVLFFIDCTSVDTQQRSNEKMIAKVLKEYSHKNLIITKSLSKEYELGDIRVGYALCTRPETAKSIYPYMAGYGQELVSNMALKALNSSNQPVIENYKIANRMLQELASKHKDLNFTGNCSNYTLVIFDTAEKCSAFKEKLKDMYGSQVYPGELPMLGGGDVGLGNNELDLTSMVNIPFLQKEALRLVVTPQSVKAFERCLVA